MKYAKLLITHLLLSCFFSVFGQNTWQDSIPPLMRQLAVAKNDTNKVLVLLKISHAYIFKEGENPEDLTAAIKFAIEASQLSAQLKFKRGIGKSQINLSAAYREKGDKATAIVYVENAIKTLEGSPYNEELIDAWQEKSFFYGVLIPDERHQRQKCQRKILQYCALNGENERYAEELINLGEIVHDSTAIGLFNQAVVIYKRIGYKKLQRLYSTIGGYYYTVGLHNLALKYGTLALITAKDQHDSSMMLCFIYNLIGLTDFRVTKLKDAQYNFQQALKIAVQHSDHNTVSLLTGNITDALYRQNDNRNTIRFLDSASSAGLFSLDDYSDHLRKEAFYVRSYTELQDYFRADTHLKRLNDFKKKINKYDWSKRISYRIELQYYLATKNIPKAKQTLADFKDFIIHQGIDDDDIYVNLDNYKLDSLQGNYLDAIKHLQSYQLALDVRERKINNRQIKEVQEEFKANEKETEIKDKNSRIALLNKQAQLQQSNIAQTKKIRNIIIIAAVILLLMLLLLLNKYKANRRFSEALSVKQDEINVKNQSLEDMIGSQTKLIEEKSWLVKEIHHRVKNNLHTIMSLLETQSAYLQDDALLAIKDSKHRVHAMSLIHQKLYNQENASRVEIIAYIKELVAYLKDGLHVKSNIIFFIKGEPVELDISHAAPLGIILNEAITNAIKYAFPEGRDGIVNIEIKALGKNRLQLVIEDNGIGLPLKFNIEKVNSLGMKLIRGLSEDFDAEFEIQSIGGTRICLTFQTDPFLH